MSYLSEYTKSIEQPEVFWAEKAADLPWFKAPQTILSKDENGIDRWFADGEMNTSYMAVDYHVEQGRGDQAALLYDSPVTNSNRTVTYSELQDQVSRFTCPDIPPISRLAPSKISIRMTLSTESRSSACVGPLDFPDMRRPLIRTLVSA